MSEKAEEDKLSGYHRRRDFDRTEEPHGRTHQGEVGPRPVFVIQHHAASAEHYDFRLEVDGVLRSWAVPKGMSTDPRDKHLAVPTEDHPLEYADFEGSIPSGEYGGGTVQVWDKGHYTNSTRENGHKRTMAEGLHKGHVSVFLHGEKVFGGYALTRIRTGGDKAWLLVKEKDEWADARRNPVSTRTESVLSGRQLEQIAEQQGRTVQGRPLEGGST